MRVAIVHGYFLHDSGSGIYVRELARALVKLGHEVTLVCQEREPARTDFIDSAFALDADNGALEAIYEAPRLYAGSCRLVRPNLSGELLVYVDGEFPPFERSHIRAFQNASAEMRDRYVERNVRALSTAFAKWPPDIVLAQHIIMQPYVVSQALGGRAPYVVTEHGSALNFSVRGNDGLVPFALEGLRDARRIATVSDPARSDLIAWASQHGLSIAEKTAAMPPGIDGDLFAPAADRASALATLRERVTLPAGFELTPDDDVVAFAGALRPTKGVQHALAAIALASRARGRRVRLLLAGDGPARGALDELARLLGAGDIAGARRLVGAQPILQSPPEWGDPIEDASGGGGTGVAFLGHVDHQQLAALFAFADASMAPSVFPEAAALVNVEALSAGAVPLAAYHSGMIDLDDYLAGELHDARFTSLAPGPHFTRRIAEQIVHALSAYPTRDPEFRRTLHATALRRYPTWAQTGEQYLTAAR